MIRKIKTALKNWRKTKRPFLSFQIEPTSRCQLRCIMCPLTTASSHDESGDMPFALYEKISRSFHLTRNVHLQGWGEPLLHARLFDMVRIARQAGCEVSMTTNGVLLNALNTESMIRDGVDIVAISIAGARAETHESIRKGSNFKKLLDNIKTFTALKTGAKTNKPKLVLSFLMTNKNIHELPDAVELSRSIGADELVATNLDYTPTQQQDDLKAFSLDHADPEFEKIIAQAKKKAQALKLPIRTYPLAMDEVLMCELNPLRITFISHDGAVSPCVYLNTPGHGPVKRIFRTKPVHIERFCPGKIDGRDFLEIWNMDEYKNFRMYYEDRMQHAQWFFGRMAFGIENMKEAGAADTERNAESPLPEICKTCYKAHGI